MGAKEVIRLIEALPENEQREVFAFIDAWKHEAEEKPRQPMSLDDAVEHVFKNYDGLLAKLAK